MCKAQRYVGNEVFGSLAAMGGRKCALTSSANAAVERMKQTVSVPGRCRYVLGAQISGGNSQGLFLEVPVLVCTGTLKALVAPE